MIPTADQLKKIAGHGTSDANVASVIAGLAKFGEGAGLDKPHRLAHYLAQLAHESGGFKYDREIWGPTKAQKGYDTRTDLGNTAAVDGDGELYKGRGPIQITGKANYTAFRDWCRKLRFGPPDFVANPDAVNTDPWEGLGPIWYWSTRKLNDLADENNVEQITKRINGGTNGLADRIDNYVRSALVLLKYEPNDVKGFQRFAQTEGYLPADEPGKDTQVDGDAGPKTRSAMHKALAAMTSATVKAAPVVEEKPVMVAPSPPHRRVTLPAGAAALVMPAVSAWAAWDLWSKLIFGGLGVIAVVVLVWQGEAVIRRIRKVVDEFGGAE